jgi:TRAP-type mannitol/chloroaromatic compound transport system substrate-binding protein
VMQEQSAADPMFKKVYKSYSDFQSNVMKYHQISEFEYYKNRAGYNQ